MMNFSKKAKREVVLFNLDFMKAFDWAEVCSVLESLKYFNFPPLIIEWVDILYKDFTIQVQNNGHLSRKLDVQRSVHQGGVCFSLSFQYPSRDYG